VGESPFFVKIRQKALPFSGRIRYNRRTQEKKKLAQARPEKMKWPVQAEERYEREDFLNDKAGNCWQISERRSYFYGGS
jgi:phage/plasmid-associated DNA primase